jgi:hypothetical protein
MPDACLITPDKEAEPGKRRRNLDRRARLEDGTVSSAATPSERPIFRRPSIQYAKVVLRFISPARTPSRLTSSRFARYARIVAFCEVPIHIAQQCGSFNTYRRVSVRLVWRFVDA